RGSDANLWTSNGIARFSPDGKSLITWEQDNILVLWDVDSKARIHTLEHDSRITDATFLPDSSSVLTACRDGLVRVWDLRTGSLVSAPMVHRRSAQVARFDSQYAYVYSGCDDGFIRQWDWKRGASLAAWRSQRTLIHDIVLSHDGQWIFSSGYGESAILET